MDMLIKLLEWSACPNFGEVLRNFGNADFAAPKKKRRHGDVRPVFLRRGEELADFSSEVSRKFSIRVK